MDDFLITVIPGLQTPSMLLFLSSGLQRVHRPENVWRDFQPVISYDCLCDVIAGLNSFTLMALLILSSLISFL